MAYAYEITGTDSPDRVIGTMQGYIVYAEGAATTWRPAAPATSSTGGGGGAYIDGYDTVVNCKYVDGKPFDRPE